MARETGDGGGERVRESGAVHGERAASLSREATSSFESMGKKANETVSGSLNFADQPIYPNEQKYAGLSSGTMTDAGSGPLKGGDAKGKDEAADSVVAKTSKRNSDGGYTDTSVHSGGSIDTTTYDKDQRAVNNRTDHPDGSFSEQSIDKNNDVRVREQKANGDYTEQVLGHDGTYSSKSHTTNADGSVTDTATGVNGVTDTTTTKDNKVVSTRSENPDGSYTEQTVNPDNSVTVHNQQKDGSYVETLTNKDGTSKTVHDVDAQGGSTTKSYDAQGNLVKDRTTRADGGFYEVTKNNDGTTTKHDQDSNGNFTEARFNDQGEMVQPVLDVKSTASTGFVDKVRDQIAQMPDGVKKLLADDRTHIVATGMVLDAMPEAAGQQPRGHEEGKTWNDLDGAQNSDTKRIITAERDRNGFSQRTDGVLKHETGHAVDRALGGDSSSPEFKAAYDKDIAAMNLDQLAKHKYELQEGDAGRSEAFAEVYGAVNGASSNPKETAQTLADYPNVAEYMRKRLNGLPH